MEGISKGKKTTSQQENRAIDEVRLYRQLAVVVEMENQNRIGKRHEIEGKSTSLILMLTH